MVKLSRLLTVALAVSTLGLSVGTMEVGPDVSVSFKSAESATFETWVNVTEKRLFEAVWGFKDRPRTPQEMKALLREARALLATQILDAKADSILLSAMWDGEGEDLVVTCLYETLGASGVCHVSR